MCFQALTNCNNQSIVSGKFPNSLKLAIISPSMKLKILLIKLTIDLSVSYLFCQRFIQKIKFLFSYLCMPTRFCVNYCAVLEKFIARNVLSLDYFSHDKKCLTIENMLALCSWIFQKLMTISLMVYLLLSWQHTVLIKFVCIC